MKTKETIEIYDITKVARGYLVEYWGGLSYMTVTVPTEKLADYCIIHNLNIIEVATNDGDVEDVILNIDAYIEENYFDLVKQYLSSLNPC